MRYLRLIAAVFALPLAGCGGGSTPPPPPPPPAVTVSISPGAMTLAPETKVQLSATVTGSTNKSVTWQVNNLTGGNSTSGTVSQAGLFTAPNTVPNPNTVKITAVSQANSSSSASAPIVIGTVNQGFQRPVKLGTSGGNSLDITTSGNITTCCSGTLGSLVQRAGTFYILSNNHVLARSNQAKLGEQIAQPGLVDSNCTPATPVASLSQFVQLPQGGTSTAPKAGTVDAAIAQIITGTVDTSGSILELGTASSTPNVPNSAPPANTIALPTLGMIVAKAGRSTGLTCSTIGSITTAVDIDYSTSCSGGTTFTVEYLNQIVINDGSFSAAGDSGSLVVKAGTAEPVGLLYGGDNISTVAQPIGQVLTAFSGGPLTIVGGATHAVVCPPATASSLAATTTVPESETVQATATAGRYATQLMANPEVAGVAVGSSLDEPGRAAVVIYVKSLTQPGKFPAELNGVRTRVVLVSAAQQRSRAPAVGVSEAEIARVTAVKEQHEERLLRANPAVFGVGVGASEDSPGEAAVVLFVDKNLPYAPPAVLDGARTKIIRGDRFRAWGWNEHEQPHACSVPKHR